MYKAVGREDGVRVDPGAHETALVLHCALVQHEQARWRRRARDVLAIALISGECLRAYRGVVSICQPSELTGAQARSLIQSSLIAQLSQESVTRLTSSAIALGWSTKAVDAERSLKIALTAVVDAEISAHSRCCNETLRPKGNG